MDGMIVRAPLRASGAVFKADIINVLTAHTVILPISVWSGRRAKLSSLGYERVNLGVVVFGVDTSVDPIVCRVVQVAHPLLVGFCARLRRHCLVDRTQIFELPFQHISFRPQETDQFSQLGNLWTGWQGIHLTLNLLFTEEDSLVVAGNGIIVVE